MLESSPNKVGLAVSTGPVAEPSMGGTPRRPGSPRQVWLGLAFVLIVFVVLASTIAVKTPAWESNDEPDHVQNIEALVAGHWYGMHVSKLRIIVLGGSPLQHR
jgi:hypothetical protein